MSALGIIKPFKKNDGQYFNITFSIIPSHNPTPQRRGGGRRERENQEKINNYEPQLYTF